MALGNVSVNNLNLGQGPVTEIERYFLFIGPASANVGKLVALNTQSDLDVELGVDDSDLKTQIIAAQLNGGDRWACMAAPITADDDWAEALDMAMQAGISVEGVIITTPVTTGVELTAMQDKATEIQNVYGRRVFFMAASRGIDVTPVPPPLQMAASKAPDTSVKGPRATPKAVQTTEGETPAPHIPEDWSVYLTAQRLITAGVAAQRVMVVPQLHGNDQGVLAGRLAIAMVSVADSPMRVATGPLQGLGPVPVDATGVPLPVSVRKELDKARFSVSQTYPDYPGVFWADGNTLDAPGSDFQVIEYLRIADKAARRIQVLMIQRVADRRLNNTPNSMATATSAFMRPLRDMARSVTVNGQVQPGDIESPKDGDVTIFWKSKTAVEIYFKVTPFNCPKELTAYIALDLSNGEEE
ncbi:DUF2586 domain-containing protein [Pseudomonas putida]|uniref:DUF2586 domain-containing protein n=1 Tax=Pseudomonas putida TaxID=303 RepID=UPI003D962889